MDSENVEILRVFPAIPQKHVLLAFNNRKKAQHQECPSQSPTSTWVQKMVSSPSGRTLITKRPKITAVSLSNVFDFK